MPGKRERAAQPRQQEIRKRKTGKKRTGGLHPAALAAGGLVLLLLVAYLALSGWASGRDVLGRNVTSGGVSLGGMTLEEGTAAALDAWQTRYGGQEITLSSQGATVGLSTAVVQPDEAALREALRPHLLSGSFLGGGARFLGSCFGTADVAVKADLAPQGEQLLEAALTDLEAQLGQSAVEPTYEIKGKNLVMHTGVTGLAFDRENAASAVVSAMNAAADSGQDGAPLVDLEMVSSPPRVLDVDAVYDAVYQKAADAYLDPETHQIAAEVVGISFDKSAAQAALDAAGEGEEVSVPLIYDQPALDKSTFAARLYRDTLGSFSTTVKGSANRVSNVRLSAQYCSDTVLLPGEVFSYNGTVGARTTARGFLPAPAYNQGETVDEVGGGICQTSSTLYAAVAKSNLEIVERHNHSYVSSYIGIAMDATVSWGGLDFQFKNNTNYPIKIVAGMSGSTLTVKVLGTMEEKFSVKLENKTLSTKPYETVEQEDPTLPQGTTKVKVTGYSGAVGELYRVVYDGNGQLISRTLENKSSYKVRNKVVLVGTGPAAANGSAQVPAESGQETGTTTGGSETGGTQTGGEQTGSTSSGGSETAPTEPDAGTDEPYGGPGA